MPTGCGGKGRIKRKTTTQVQDFSIYLMVFLNATSLCATVLFVLFFFKFIYLLFFVEITVKPRIFCISRQ